jgi:hypothetical protein
MKVEFQLTADDYADAQWTHARKSLGKLPIVALIFIGLSGMVYVWGLFHPSLQLVAQFRPMGYLALLLAILGFYLWSGLPYRMQFRKTPALQSPFQVEAGPEGITIIGVNGHSYRAWQGFIAFRESKKSFLLYMQRRAFFILPKRASQPEELSSFRELAKSHITRASQSRPSAIISPSCNSAS